MIHAIAIITENDTLLFRKAYSEKITEDNFSNILRTFISVSKEFGYGSAQRVELGDYDLTIMGVKSLSWYVGILSDRGDKGSEFITQLIASYINLISYKLAEIDLKSFLLEIRNKLRYIIESKRPSLKYLKDLAEEIYAHVVNDSFLKFRVKFLTGRQKTILAEVKSFEKQINEAKKRVDKEFTINEFFNYLKNWKLYDAFVLAEKEFFSKDNLVAGILLLKLGIMIKSLRLQFPSPSLSYLNKVYSRLNELPADEPFSYLVDIISSELKTFYFFREMEQRFKVISNYEVLEKLLRHSDKNIRRITAFICASEDILLNHRNISDHLLRELSDISFIYYHIFRISKKIEILTLLFSEENYDSLLRIFEENRIRYLDSKREFKDIANQIGFRDKITGLSDELQVKYFNELSKYLTFIYLYLLSLLCLIWTFKGDMEDLLRYIQEFINILQDDYRDALRNKIPVPVILILDTYTHVCEILNILSYMDVNATRKIFKKLYSWIEESLIAISNVMSKNRENARICYYVAEILGKVDNLITKDKTNKFNLFLLNYSSIIYLSCQKAFDSDHILNFEFTFFDLYLSIIIFILSKYIYSTPFAKSFRTEIMDTILSILLDLLRRGLVPKDLIFRVLVLVNDALYDNISLEQAQNYVFTLLAILESLSFRALSTIDKIILGSQAIKMLHKYVKKFEKNKNLTQLIRKYSSYIINLLSKIDKEKVNRIKKEVEEIQEILT